MAERIEAKAFVLQHHPEAFADLYRKCIWLDRLKTVMTVEILHVRILTEFGGEPIGMGLTEAEAWQDAAERLAKDPGARLIWAQASKPTGYVARLDRFTLAQVVICKTRQDGLRMLWVDTKHERRPFLVLNFLDQAEALRAGKDAPPPIDAIASIA